ncbi:MAG: hypothetical protein ACXWNF_12395 [Isosphaeraceae bacterium]
MAGLVVGLVAHPLCWFLFLLFQVARDSTLRCESVSSLVFGLVWMTATFTFSSLLGSGWITVPLCAALGYLSKRIKASASHRR